MKIELYKSSLCPRCAYAAYAIKRLQDEFDDLKLVSYDIVTDFQVFKDSKIRMIPTVKFEDNSESWIIPKATEIREFILKHKDSKERSAVQNA